jgi:hypothetical protein
MMAEKNLIYLYLCLGRVYFFLPFLLGFFFGAFFLAAMFVSHPLA